MKLLTQNEFGQISQGKSADGIEFIDITHANCQARVSLYGGQVLSWQPTGQMDVFWLSKTAKYQQGEAIRGGIPLCWPWFGGYQDAGNHGFARTQVWQLEGSEITHEGVEVTLTWQGENMHPLWPNAARLTQRLCFGARFSQTLMMENLSDEDVRYTGAMHSYFAVSDPSKVTVTQLNGVPFDCKLSLEQKITDVKENMTGPMDRIYYSGETLEVVDTGLNRMLKLSTENTHQWVMWNPGTVTAQSMADIHPQGEDEFFCLEAANTQWQVIKAKESAVMSQTIEVINTPT